MSRPTIGKTVAPRRLTIVRIVRVLVVLGAISLGAPQAAHAYIDPLSGSIVFQALLAGVLGALLTIRRWWATVFRFVRALFTRVAGR